jgi:superfamily II DNA or RNA helicase
MYKIGCKKGDGYIVNESHILSLKYGTDMNRNIKKNTVLDISVTDYLNLPSYYHGRGGPLYGYRVPIVFPEQEVEMDPYLLGYWLCTPDVPLPFPYPNYEKYCNDVEKYIPYHYKCNSRKIQLELLAGIVDSYATHYYGNNNYKINLKPNLKPNLKKDEKNDEKNNTKGTQLLQDILYICRSLGFHAYKYKNGIKLYAEDIPVKNPKKKSEKSKRDCLKYRITVTPIGIDDYYGFEIDGNHRFVLGDYTVTHNTVMALKIISELKCPALIYVNKGFLADQWLERIATYLPNASVGRVQADTFDIENRDIVICMIQTIYNRDYVAKNEFKDFGITIIDEVHRIGSGEFSKALFNITTPYVLGISATVDRKDGMESVLKMFLGGMLYSDKRQDGECVQIRCVEYADRDNDYYNKEEHDFRGNVKYSTMMSKICEHRKRTDFLYRLLCDLVAEYPENLSEEFPDVCIGVGAKELVVSEKQEPQVECPVCHGQVGLSKLVNISCKHSLCEKCLDDLEQPKCPTCKKRFTLVFSGEDSKMVSKNTNDKIEPKNETVLTEYPGQNQIIVLAQYREVLRELYARITEKGLTTVGYYVGGMKQKDLDISKTKQIILATYSMASEGLDVATLSTLVFATPRTDIKQSVGRILRQKHARNPIVVDVVDTHKTFKNQATKRRTYYRQNGYAIYKCGYEEYRDMTEVETRWKVAYHPSKAKVSKSDAVTKTLAGGSGEEHGDSDTDSDADEKKLAFDGVCML